MSKQNRGYYERISRSEVSQHLKYLEDTHNAFRRPAPRTRIPDFPPCNGTKDCLCLTCLMRQNETL